MSKSSAPRPRQSTGRTVSPDRSPPTKLALNEIARPRKYAKWYANKSYKEIAAALGLLVARIKQQAKCFEAAAHWYWLDERAPTRSRPTDMQTQLIQIRDAADKLLAHLGIENLDDASDGPGDPEVFGALISAMDNGTEDDVTKATASIAWLTEFFEAICATVELRERAHQAAGDVIRVGQLTIPKGYQGDRALSYWTLWMLAIHKQLTGVDARLPLNRSQSTKLYRFLAAEGRPLAIERTRSQWKEHVRTVINWPTD